MLTLNYAKTSLKRVTLNGEEYVVAPLTLLVPGILNGSRGPLYYPHLEVSASVRKWENMPMVVNHPVANDGTPIAASSPGGLKNKIGFLKSPRLDSDKLRADGWFNIELTKRIEPSIYDALMAGEKIEVSTGLFTDNIQKRGTHQGQEYHYIATNYRPDHLAILPFQQGACSIYDGCGVNNRTTDNVFCTTGQGGGVDPTCRKGGHAGPKTSRKTKTRLKKFSSRLAPSKKTNTKKQSGSSDGKPTRTKDQVVKEWVEVIEKQKTVKQGSAEHKKLSAREKELKAEHKELQKSNTSKPKVKSEPVKLDPSNKVKGTSHTVGDLEEASVKAGKKLFGSALEHQGIMDVKTVKLSSLKKLGDAEGSVNDFEYVFFPSTGKGKDASGASIGKKLADKDGKVYLYDATDATVRVVTLNLRSNLTNNRKGSTMKLSSGKRKELVDNLIANCSCGGHSMFTKDDVDVLNAKKDEELMSMSACMSKMKQMEKNAKKVKNKDEEEDDEEKEIPRKFKDAGKEYQYNSSTKKWECTVNSKPKTADEWLADAPAEVQTVVRNALAVEKVQRNTLIESIVANANNPYTKEELEAKTTDELTKIGRLSAGQHQPEPMLNWSGAAAPFVPPSTPLESPLTTPVIDWTKAD